MMFDITISSDYGREAHFTTASESTTVSMSVFDAVVSAAVVLLFVLSGWLVVTGR
jgi:hypothetical protein